MKNKKRNRSNFDDYSSFDEGNSYYCNNSNNNKSQEQKHSRLKGTEDGKSRGYNDDFLAVTGVKCPIHRNDVIAQAIHDGKYLLQYTYNVSNCGNELHSTNSSITEDAVVDYDESRLSKDDIIHSNLEDQPKGILKSSHGNNHTLITGERSNNCFIATKKEQIEEQILIDQYDARVLLLQDYLSIPSTSTTSYLNHVIDNKKSNDRFDQYVQCLNSFDNHQRKKSSSSVSTTDNDNSDLYPDTKMDLDNHILDFYDSDLTIDEKQQINFERYGNDSSCLVQEYEQVFLPGAGTINHTNTSTGIEQYEQSITNIEICTANSCSMDTKEKVISEVDEGPPIETTGTEILDEVKGSCNDWLLKEQKDDWVDIPMGMKVPTTEAQNKLIKFTAMKSISTPQFEILLKMKQSSNELFSFLQCNDELYPYYEWCKNINRKSSIPTKDETRTVTESERKNNHGNTNLLVDYDSSSSSSHNDEGKKKASINQLLDMYSSEENDSKSVASSCNGSITVSKNQSTPTPTSIILDRGEIANQKNNSNDSITANNNNNHDTNIVTLKSQEQKELEEKRAKTLNRAKMMKGYFLLKLNK